MLEARVTSHEQRLLEGLTTLERQRQHLHKHLHTTSLAQDILYEVFCPSASFTDLTTSPDHPGGDQISDNGNGNSFDPPRQLEHGMRELGLELVCVRA